MRVSDADSAARLTATVFATVIGIVFVVVGALIGTLLDFSGGRLLAIAAFVGLTAGYLTRTFTLAVSNGAGASFLAFLQPSGRSSPYEAEFSQAQAFVAKGDVPGALALYESEIVRLPANEVVRIQAADLHARQGNPQRAESLFLEVRGMTNDRGRELYATQRLIDLRLGVLGQPERALPELRRLIERFPGTREGDGARAALARIKQERRAGVVDGE
jgi:tetratricopeptide (TPR) repeat protein